MAGRKPHKFRRDTIDRLLRGIRMGLTYELSCMHAGISFQTLCNWKEGKFPRDLSDDEKELKDGFLDLLTRAEGDSAARHMSTIMQAAAQGDWKASAWALERRWPHHYGKEVVELTGKDGGPIELSSKSRQLIEELAVEEGISGDQEELVAAVQSYLAGEREDQP